MNLEQEQFLKITEELFKCYYIAKQVPDYLLEFNIIKQKKPDEYTFWLVVCKNFMEKLMVEFEKIKELEPTIEMNNATLSEQIICDFAEPVVNNNSNIILNE